MRPLRVVVVGAGVAGTAAAWTASKEAAVTLVDGGTGASTLAGGALDEVDWESVSNDVSPKPLDEHARAVLDALEAYAVEARPALLAVTTGLVRPARGRDRALLDLQPLAGRTVFVPAGEYPTWDAPTLAAAWSESPGSRALGLAFVAGACSLLQRTDELVLEHAELAALHDDPARLAWLAARLREGLGAVARADAIVLPPWLGVTRERASELSRLVGVPCGEALGGVGGPSGLRFEAARDRALDAAGAVVTFGRVSGVHTTGDATSPWRVERDGGPPILADRVVLATGGVLGGGLAYSPAGSVFGEVLPLESSPLVRLFCEAPVQLGAFARRLDEASSLYGSAPETHAWPYVESPLLDHAGILADAHGEALGAPGLYAAGEVKADVPHTWLGALVSGARSGRAATRR